MGSLPELDLVTGAFGYTGSFIAERLLQRGHQVRTLTRRAPGAHRLAGQLEAIPLDFGQAKTLEAAFDGVDTVYNTFWRRLPRQDVGFDDIVARSEQLIAAARSAGVRRFVQFSVSNASADAPTDYFRAKARIERVVQASGLSYAILRPTLLFGPGDILINNLAWTMRRLPLFGMPGDGAYRVQPVFVGDVADLAVELGASDRQAVVTAAGPDIYRFDDLARLIRGRIGASVLIVGVPIPLALAASRFIGRAVRDVVLTRDEITELTTELLVSPEPPTCSTSIDTWLAAHSTQVGRRYASELDRNYGRQPG